MVGLRAAKGRLERSFQLFQTIISSSRPNLQWFSQYSQLVQTLVQMKMQEIRNTGEISRMISRTQQEVSAMMRRTYEERQAAQDRISQNFSQYLRGVEAYRDPTDNRAVELPSGYREAWSNSQGEYLMSDDPNFNPNAGSTANWQRLERR
jgi:hypothetical protein